MPFHQRAHLVKDNLELPGNPLKNEFHTYHVHRNGHFSRETSHDRDNSLRSSGVLNTPLMKDDFCDQDRLTLIHLPKDKIVLLEPPQEDQPYQSRVPWPNNIDVPPIPQAFIEKLENICTYCDCKREILWRNFHRADSNFEACFRYHDDGKTNPSLEARRNKCFLKLYTLRIPYLADKNLVLSMVHHIRAEGKNFVSARSGSGSNQEHIFGLIAGFDAFDLTEIFTRLVPRWSDIGADHLQDSTGLTPKLFLAAVISQYGFITSREIYKSFLDLQKSDTELSNALAVLQTLPPDRFEQIQGDTNAIRKMNSNLIEMNTKLTGTKSVIHYLASSSEILIDRISAFETYVATRLLEWDENPDRKALKKQLFKLDSSKEKLRDRDKLQIVQKTMQQHIVDIDALHQHIDINVSMVRNLIAEKDRAIQFFMAIKSDQDAFNMKIIAILTAFFLPGTFMAVLLTTPMFKWDRKPEDPLILKLPFKIYWATSGSLTIIFAFLLLMMTKPGIVKGFIDRIPFEKVRKACQNTEFYGIAKERVFRKVAFNEEKNDAIKRRRSQHDGKDEESRPREVHLAGKDRMPAMRIKSVSVFEMEEGRSSSNTI